MKDNLDKLKLEAQASENGVKSVFDELTAGLKSLATDIETLAVSIGTSKEKYDSLEKQSQDLNAELAQHKQEHQTLEQIKKRDLLIYKKNFNKCNKLKIVSKAK